MSQLSGLSDPAVNRQAPASTLSWRVGHFGLAAIIFALDQVTKAVISNRVPLNTGWIEVIPGFFSITHVQNRGAAFSLFSDGNSSWKLGMLITFSLVAMVAISYFLWKSAHRLTITSLALALVLGGAFGNLWDRIVHGRVTDFLHFYVGEYSWPDFNVADTAIVIGAVLIIAEIIFTPHQEHR